MEKERNILDKCAGREPFSVPDGYFAGLTDSIMSSLPQPENDNKAVVVTPWMRLRPYLYMAAAFAGMFFCLKWAAGLNTSNQTDVAQTQETTIYSDEYIDSFLETAMIDDYTLYYAFVDAAN